MSMVWEFFSRWLLMFGWMFVGTCLFSGMIRGLYPPLKNVFGYSNAFLEDSQTGLFVIILAGGVFSIVGGLFGTTLVYYFKTNEMYIVYGIGIGGVFGLLYPRIKKAIWKFMLANSRVTGGFIAACVGGSIGGLFGELAGVLTGGILGGIAGGLEGRLVAGLTVGLSSGLVGGFASTVGGLSAKVTAGVVVGVIGGVCGGILGVFDAWMQLMIALGGLGGGIIAGIIGGTVSGERDGMVEQIVERLTGGRFDGTYGRIDDWNTVEPGGKVVLGAMMGVIYGLVVSGSITAIIVTPAWSFVVIGLGSIVGLSIARGLVHIIAGIAQFVIQTFFILWRCNTVICRGCLRYTSPLQSVYKDGIRYCEHCQKPVERTSALQKLIVTFGTAFIEMDNEVFSLSNPGVQFMNNAIDVSAVYIDTTTADPLSIERFLTYIINHPPKYGVQSVDIFYQGTLDELGENLKNALHNTFIHVEQV